MEDHVTSGPDVIASECNQTCQAAAIQLTGARFSNEGNIVIDLTSQAKGYSGNCGPIFEAPTFEMLGSSAECTTRGQELHVLLKGDATVVTGDVLRLRVSQNTLVNKVDSVPFEGSSEPVSICSKCDLPQAIIKGPTTLNEQCKPSSEGLISFLGAASSGPSDRPFTSVLWSLASAPAGEEVPSLLKALSDANNRHAPISPYMQYNTFGDVCGKAHGKLSLLLQLRAYLLFCFGARASFQSVNFYGLLLNLYIIIGYLPIFIVEREWDMGSLNLDLSSTTVNELAAGEYTLSFRVDSFLGTSNVAEHSFTKQSGNTSPSVSMAASDALYSKGIALEVSVSTQDVLCSGNQWKLRSARPSD
eukprot:1144829-Pelagomonas_calceolata.AAC.2